jgi:WD40 repeat protein
MSASADSSFQIYSLSGKIILKKHKSHDQVPVNVLKSIGQNLIATGADDGSVKLWDIASKSLVNSWKENSDYISDMLSMDHQIIVTGSDGLLSIFDDRNKKALAVSEYQEDELTCCCLVKNGTKLAVGTDSGTLLLFNVGEWGDHTDRIKMSHGAIESIIKLNESIVIVGFDDGSIYTVNLFPNSIGKCLHAPNPNTYDSLMLSFDSKLVLGMSSTDECETLVKLKTLNFDKHAHSFFADLE